jgi:4-amino-4-deoxy-L-arabinose transferase-like glycosyltransferase
LREILLVVLVSLGLRSFNLLSLPIFVDEITYISWGVDIWDQRTRAALMMPIAVDGKQPLFMWLAGGASQLFSDPTLAGRVVSVVAGVLSAVGIYLIGRWLAGNRVGLVAGLLYAAVPFNLFYDRMALVEALLNAAGVWALLFSVFLATRASTTRSTILAGLGLGVALGAALWTKMPGLFMLPFPFLCALLLLRSGRLSTVARGYAVAAAVYAVGAVALFLAPEAGNLFYKASGFSETPQSLLTYFPGPFFTNIAAYWDWLQVYVPAPLAQLILVAAAWGLVRRTRVTLLLLGCWAAFTMPTTVMSRAEMYNSRYVSEGVFPLLLLLALLLAASFEALWTGVKGRWGGAAVPRTVQQLAGIAALAILMAPALSFDAQLLNAPDTAPLHPRDRITYVTSLNSGYGFMDAVKVVRQRATELTRNGQSIIVLGNFYFGHTYSGLKLYLRGIPGIVQHVDGHLSRGMDGFAAAWRPHGVPILVVGNEGWDHREEFEKALPKAKRLGVFPKPTGESAFWVYEVDVEDLVP